MHEMGLLTGEKLYTESLTHSPILCDAPETEALALRNSSHLLLLMMPGKIGEMFGNFVPSGEW